MIKIKEFLGLSCYISKLDELLATFDKNHPDLSASQRKEKEKYKRIYNLRDNPNHYKPQKKFWENF